MAAMLYPERHVLAVSGDGELAGDGDRRAARIDLVVLILEDSAYGMIRRKQAVDKFPDWALTFGNPDFVKYAESLGAVGRRAERTPSLTARSRMVGGSRHGSNQLCVEYAHAGRGVEGARGGDRVTKEVVMPLRQDFAEQVKAQTEVWRGQIKAYQEQMEQAGAKAMADYKKAMEQMEAKAKEARRLAEQVHSANESAWKDMQTATVRAFAELQKGWADAISRFT